jgi:hypothetical protein
MTPDTTAYMVAGFVVILGGIVVYVISLILRDRQVQKLTRELEDLEKDL